MSALKQGCLVTLSVLINMLSTMKDIARDEPVNNATQFDDFFGMMYFEPYAIEVAKRVDPDTEGIVLEIAAGTGRVTRYIREKIPASATLIASDIDGEMLAVAEKKLAHLNIEWKELDAQELPFSDNSISLVVCCFGYMFVANRSKAFAEAYRVLKPGGRLIFTTWDKLQNNAASYTARTIIEQYLKSPLGAAHNMATSMHDEGLITKLLSDAQFTTISVETVRLLSATPTAKAAAHALVSGGSTFKEINPDDVEEITARVEISLAEKFGTAPMAAPMSALITQAWK